ARVVVSYSWICDRSAEMPLFSSPTLRLEKKFIGRVISLKYVSRLISANDLSATCTNQSILKKETKACENKTIKASKPIPWIVAGNNLLVCFPCAASIKAPKNEGNARPTRLDKNKKSKAAANFTRYGRI